MICNRRSLYIKYCDNDEYSFKCMKLFCTTRGNIKRVQKILSKRNNKSHLNVQNWAWIEKSIKSLMFGKKHLKARVTMIYHTEVYYKCSSLKLQYSIGKKLYFLSSRSWRRKIKSISWSAIVNQFCIWHQYILLDLNS